MMGSARAIRSRQIVMISFMIIFYGLSGDLFNQEARWYLVSLSLGIFGYLPFYCFCQALRIGSVGVVQAIGNSFPVVVSFLGVQFMGLSLSSPQWFGIFITIGGIALLSLGKMSGLEVYKKSPDFRKSILLSLAACFLWGIFFTAVQIPNSFIGFIAHTFCVQTGSFMGAELHILFSRIPKRNISRSSLWSGIIGGLLAITGSLSFYKAIGSGHPGVVTAIAGSSPVVASIFGVYVLKENMSRLEYAGVMLAVLGVVILGLATL